MVSILSQINRVHTLPSYLSYALILTFHLGLGYQNGLSPSYIPTLYVCLLSRLRVISPAHLIFLDFITVIISSEEKKW
jgi:hypothetical protein